MAFKFYLNKKTQHPSISVKQKDNQNWHNMPISHSKAKGKSYIEINDPHPDAKSTDKSYARKYIRVDRKGIRGHKYHRYKLSTESELKIKKYLSHRYKKR